MAIDEITDMNDLSLDDKWAPQLGYAEDPETPLTADTFPSKSGGKPAWLNPEHVLNVDQVTCTNCDQPMVLLVQLYTPEDHPPQAFHRTVYVFCCKNGACVKQDWTKCFKVFRSQLPRENPYYPPPPNEDGEDDEEMSFVAKEFKAPKLCVICGMAGPKACGQCQLVNYCSREHQMVDWNMCQHKQHCKSSSSLTQQQQQRIDQLRKTRVFAEKEIASEPEGKGEDGEEEEAQAAFSQANQDTSSTTTTALVPAGEETAEDSKVTVDDCFLRFQLKLQLYPDQVLRYDRVEYDMPDREPLWVQEHQRPTNIPPCVKCGGPRTFEFQILSTLLNFLDVSHLATDSLDWGSLYIYSCKHNCDVGDQVFVPEFIWKQDFSTDSMNFGGPA
ncbi:programmed cell death protein 2 [Halteromyces radiatus]|uniref:programmed cell death protein 2 n=1 Tax=Halteromyces radiatus TaxID=101107 RepID=UPI00222017DB|nr:programmed cell death protein 2 [Halteromyces radiatus]KAI8093515.1 programmed cell death protein 2 [Halteromyces radiatus]